MRQLVEFLRCIRRRRTTNEYYHLSFFAKLHNAEMTPLESILGVDLEETENKFDTESEAALEKRALQLLHERRQMALITNGR